jgi:hypothetical protein
MDLFGIGPLELAFIAIIILLVLGPKEMVSALRTIGQAMRNIVMSPWWESTRQAIQDVRKLPYDLMRDAGLDEDLEALDEIRRTAAGSTSDLDPWAKKMSSPPPKTDAWTQPYPPEQDSPAVTDSTASEIPPNTIMPPASQEARAEEEAPEQPPKDTSAEERQDR